jgi:DNA-binding HxlR family transcriptional regulator
MDYIVTFFYIPPWRKKMKPSVTRGAVLARLFHHRWALPILVLLFEQRGARFVVLHRTLGINRDSLRVTLAALGKAGLARPNPGYGHPLRPEYLLTEEGSRLGPSGLRFLQAAREMGAESVALRKWSMPVLDAVAAGHGRFSELEQAIDGITPRALAQALKQLHAAGLILREIRDAYPPRAVHSLSERGARLAASLEDLIIATTGSGDNCEGR